MNEPKLTIIPSELIRLETVGSTNDYAGDLLGTRRPAGGTVVWALEQTAGRGQGDRRWSSEPGRNLTLTVILYPYGLDPVNLFMLNKAVALGVYDLLAEYARQVTIKWPNDIYIGLRKAAGILIENRFLGSVPEVTMAGIGINVNQMDFETGIPNPVSLARILGKPLPLEEIFYKLCLHLQARWNMLENCRYEQLNADYNRTLLFFNTPRQFSVSSVSLSGTITGVDETGHLLVADGTGKIHPFAHGEIGFEFENS